MEYFHAQDTLFAMSDKRKYIKNTYAEKRKEKLGIKKWKRNLTKVPITTKGNESLNMNMEKGGIRALQARKYLYFLLSTAEEKGRLGKMIIILTYFFHDQLQIFLNILAAVFLHF